MPATKPATETSSVSSPAAVPAKTGHPESAAASDTVPQLTSELSIESIGWLFLQKYYASYTADIRKLYAFYDSDAALLHDSFPGAKADAETSKTRAVHVANGSESVRAFYDTQGDESAATEKNKIVVETAAFQKSVDDAILIVVAGAWKRGSSQLYHFNQTFVLRAKGKTVYDIANDVLAFVDIATEHKETVTTVNVVETPTVSAETAASEEKTETSAVSTPVAAEPTTVAATEETVPASTKDSEESVEEPAAEETESAKETVDAQSEESADTVSEPEKPAAPAAPAQKPTWATLAAIGPKTAAKSTSVAATIASKTVVASAGAGAGAGPGLASKKAASPSQTAAQQAAAAASGKYKKEEWYPIYIKNVDVDDEELKAALVKQFGDIKFFKRTNKTALVDFRSKDGQQKALEQREMAIRNNVILLEPRIHKTFNGKPDAKKDKKHVKKPVNGNGNGNVNGFKKN